MKEHIEEQNILVTTYKQGWKSKKQMKKEIGTASEYFNGVKLDANKVLTLNSNGFKAMLEKGIAHVPCNYYGDSRRKNDIYKVKVNVFCFDIDDLSGIPIKKLEQFNKRVRRSFHFIQESFSSGEKSQDKRYHCYLICEEIEGSVEFVTLIYRRLRDQLSAELGVQFDKSIYPAKIIAASNHPVTVNNQLKVKCLSSLIKQINEEQQKIERKKLKGKIKPKKTLSKILNADYVKRNQLESLNFEALLNAVSDPNFTPVNNYDDWFCFLSIFQNLENGGYITEDQKHELAVAIDDGNRNYHNEFKKLKKYSYPWNIGTLIRELQFAEVPTKGISVTREKWKVKPDITFEVDGYISDNLTIYQKLKQILQDPKNIGKKMLLFADTGIGKSVAIRDIMADITNEEKNTLHILSAPRLKLINNFKKDFKKIPQSISLTGSDRMSQREWESEVNKARNILTTIDHAPKVLSEKLVDNSVGQIISIFDESHFFGEDSKFKENAIVKFMEMEMDVLQRGGIALHVTATPEFVYKGDYDLIIQIHSNNRELPFKEAVYTELKFESGKALYQAFAGRIVDTLRKKPKKKLLVFIENKDLIKEIQTVLEDNAIKSLGVESKVDKLQSNDECLLVNDGQIPVHIDAVLSTSCLAAGTSITNNEEVDETWVLCTHKSINHDLTRIIQASNRFRNKYAKLHLFFEGGENEIEQKFFPYFSLLEGKINNANKFKQVAESFRETGLSMNTSLDGLEQENGLISDSYGQLHVCTPLLQAEVIENQYFFHTKHYKSLISLLEKRLEIEFSNEPLTGTTSTTRTMLLPTRANLNEAHDAVMEELLQNEQFYVDLKRNYALIGNHDMNLKAFKRKVRNDIVFCIENGLGHQDVKKILIAHKHSRPEIPISFVTDIKAYHRGIELKKLSSRTTLDAMLYHHLWDDFIKCNAIGNTLEFNSKKEFKRFLSLTLKQIAANHGVNSRNLEVNVKQFEEMIDLVVKKTNGIRKFTIKNPAKPFKGRHYILRNYDIDPIKIAKN